MRYKKNTIITDETGTYLLLTSRKHGTAKAYFDLEDIEKVDKYTWGLHRSATRREETNLEVCTRVKDSDGKKHNILFLHQYLFPVARPLIIDHIDRQPLNCQKGNLRAVTQQQNQFNRGGTKGYSFCEKAGKYRARIILNKKFICLGYYVTEEAASIAYQHAKDIYHTY